MTIKSESNGNLSVERESNKIRDIGREKGKDESSSCNVATASVCVCFVFVFLSYGSITISLIHCYGLAVSAGKIMFA